MCVKECEHVYEWLSVNSISTKQHTEQAFNICFFFLQIIHLQLVS